jgi:ABC-type molybdenum transport system ATPase subunit/photorepair protein PhrA
VVLDEPPDGLDVGNKTWKVILKVSTSYTCVCSPPARDEHACSHVVLDEPPDGLAVGGHDELPVSVHNVVALGTAQVVLQRT